jgi:AcrR family transcriptional regulator
MPSRTTRSTRRTDPLSQERLVGAAIEILDAQGEDALTFRLLAARLSTGPGAIYHHVANKDELLKAAASQIIASAIVGAQPPREPAEAIRSTAAAVFDAIDTHPWAGAQLAREPWQLAVIRLFETFGQHLQALDVPKPAHFDAVSTLVNYILGLAGQYAAGARVLGPHTDRAMFLRGIAEQWEQLNPTMFPFMRSISAGLDQHDDRTQFLAGIDLILAGTTSRYPICYRTASIPSLHEADRTRRRLGMDFDG